MTSMTSWPPTSQDIKRALARHHSKDVFVEECKNGPTWVSTGLARLDSWVLLRTWTPLTTIGYEIKVSRSDFEADQKWPQYLALCHQFYFVCPAGLIKAVDLPPGIGLKYMTKSGTIHTKLRGERREPDAAKFAQLLCYIVMARAVITSNGQLLAPQPDHLDTLREIVETAEKKKTLASIVSTHVQQRFREMSQRVEEASRMEAYAQRFTEQLKLMGIHWDPQQEKWSHTAEVERQIRRLGCEILDEGELIRLSRFGENLVGFVAGLKRVRDEIMARQPEGEVSPEGEAAAEGSG